MMDIRHALAIIQDMERQAAEAEAQSALEIALAAMVEKAARDRRPLPDLWRDVETDPPDEDGSYLVQTESGAVCTARWYCQSRNRGPGRFSGYAGKYAVLWMPLPAPRQLNGGVQRVPDAVDSAPVADRPHGSNVELFRMARNVTPYLGADEFLCSACGFEGPTYEVLRDENGDGVAAVDYQCRYCPCCGAMIVGGRAE